MTGAGECLEVWDRGAWTDYNAALSDELPDITRRPSAMLVDMTTTHVPVLAGELDRRSRPPAGRDRGRLHVRRRRPRAPGRRAPRAGRRADRHRPRPRRRGALRRARGRRGLPHALHPRVLRRGARGAARRGRRRRPRLPRPRHVLHAGRHPRARLLLRLRRAAGHAHGPRRRSSTRRRRRQRVGRAPAGARCSATTARSATRGPSPARSSAHAPHGPLVHDQRARRDHHRRHAGPRAVRRRPPGQARLPGDPHRGQRRARPARRGAARRLGAAPRPMADLQGFPSIRWKTDA